MIRRSCICMNLLLLYIDIDHFQHTQTVFTLRCFSNDCRLSVDAVFYIDSSCREHAKRANCIHSVCTCNNNNINMYSYEALNQKSSEFKFLRSLYYSFIPFWKSAWIWLILREQFVRSHSELFCLPPYIHPNVLLFAINSFYSFDQYQWISIFPKF